MVGIVIGGAACVPAAALMAGAVLVGATCMAADGCAVLGCVALGAAAVGFVVFVGVLAGATVSAGALQACRSNEHVAKRAHVDRVRANRVMELPRSSDLKDRKPGANSMAGERDKTPQPVEARCVGARECAENQRLRCDRRSSLNLITII